MSAYIFTIIAYLLLILGFFFNPVMADYLRWMGIGGRGCALTTFIEILTIWMIFALIGGILSIIALARGRCDIWHILVIIASLPAFIFFIDMFDLYRT